MQATQRSYGVFQLPPLPISIDAGSIAARTRYAALGALPAITLSNVNKLIDILQLAIDIGDAEVDHAVLGAFSRLPTTGYDDGDAGAQEIVREVYDFMTSILPSRLYDMAFVTRQQHLRQWLARQSRMPATNGYTSSASPVAPGPSRPAPSGAPALAGPPVLSTVGAGLQPYVPQPTVAHPARPVRETLFSPGLFGAGAHHHFIPAAAAPRVPFPTRGTSTRPSDSGVTCTGGPRRECDEADALIAAALDAPERRRPSPAWTLRGSSTSPPSRPERRRPLLRIDTELTRQPPRHPLPPAPRGPSPPAPPRPKVIRNPSPADSLMVESPGIPRNPENDRAYALGVRAGRRQREEEYARQQREEKYARRRAEARERLERRARVLKFQRRSESSDGDVSPSPRSRPREEWDPTARLGEQRALQLRARAAFAAQPPQFTTHLPARPRVPPSRRERERDERHEWEYTRRRGDRYPEDHPHIRGHAHMNGSAHPHARDNSSGDWGTGHIFAPLPLAPRHTGPRRVYDLTLNVDPGLPRAWDERRPLPVLESRLESGGGSGYTELTATSPPIPGWVEQPFSAAGPSNYAARLPSPVPILPPSLTPTDPEWWKSPRDRQVLREPLRFATDGERRVSFPMRAPMAGPHFTQPRIINLLHDVSGVFPLPESSSAGMLAPGSGWSSVPPVPPLPAMPLLRGRHSHSRSRERHDSEPLVEISELVSPIYYPSMSPRYMPPSPGVPPIPALPAPVPPIMPLPSASTVTRTHTPSAHPLDFNSSLATHDSGRTYGGFDARDPRGAARLLAIQTMADETLRANVSEWRSIVADPPCAEPLSPTPACAATTAAVVHAIGSGTFLESCVGVMPSPACVPSERGSASTSPTPTPHTTPARVPPAPSPRPLFRPATFDWNNPRPAADGTRVTSTNPLPAGPRLTLRVAPQTGVSLVTAPAEVSQPHVSTASLIAALEGGRGTKRARDDDEEEVEEPVRKRSPPREAPRATPPAASTSTAAASLAAAMAPNRLAPRRIPTSAWHAPAILPPAIRGVFRGIGAVAAAGPTNPAGPEAEGRIGRIGRVSRRAAAFGSERHDARERVSSYGRGGTCS